VKIHSGLYKPFTNNPLVSLLPREVLLALVTTHLNVADRVSLRSTCTKLRRNVDGVIIHLSLPCLVEQPLNMMISEAWNRVVRGASGSENEGPGGSIVLAMQKVLKDMKLYGGKAKIKVDLKKSPKNGPSKHKQISLKGTMCTILLEEDNGIWWKRLIYALAPDLERRTLLIHLWETLQKVVWYLHTHVQTEERKAAWPAVKGDFLRAWKLCYYGPEYTRYMYILSMVGRL
jgi:hypothetical protein